MSWATPWAFAGLALLAIPVFIHLMGLDRARQRRFPSLRFIAASRLKPSRRTRMHDLPLLLLRLAILTMAILALARPVPRNRAAPAAGATLSRVVIVDTSASVRGRGVDTVATRLADSAAAGAGTILRTADPGSAFAGAAAWLATQPGRAEIVVISDFQLGAVDSADMASIPAGVHVRLLRAGSPDATTRTRERFTQARKDIVADASVFDGRTAVAWHGETPAGIRRTSGNSGPVTVLAGATETRTVTAVMEASELIAVPAAVASANADSVVLALPSYGGRGALLRDAVPLRAPWQGDLLARIVPDPAWLAAGIGSVHAAAATIDGRDRLVLFASTTADDPATLALVGAVRRARAGATLAAELDPGVLSDSSLAALGAIADARAGLPVRGHVTPQADVAAAVDADSAPAVRWLWVLALVALGLEAIVRRTTVRPANREDMPDVA